MIYVQDKESVMELLKIIDKSNGYVFRGIEGNINEFSKLAAAPTNWDYDRYPFILCGLWILTKFKDSFLGYHF